eukprot:TRINITY_DN20392_c0_g1_i3.p1 TRINITY_DN20392_c0_g1~~TRINITY_DN20392_c0_g1_i3.p1  ORF type:complete len:296 (+),score=12.21 TRINITY_DN20392_c0_g1_i3:133-1020(+)
MRGVIVRRGRPVLSRRTWLWIFVWDVGRCLLPGCCQGFLKDDQGAPSQVSVAIVCGEKDVCCTNDQSDPYCCASGNSCSNNVCVAGSGQCFSGDASVSVRGRGQVRLAELRLDDFVLVDRSLAEPAYEPVTRFLHASPDDATAFLTIGHQHGELRISDSHFVFTATPSGTRFEKSADAVKVGDELVVSGLDSKGGALLTSSRVFSVRRSSNSKGMYAPLTSSGKIIVDGVVASTFAQPARGLQVSHGAMHAAFYFSRVSSFFQPRGVLYLFSHAATLPLAALVIFTPSGISEVRR